MKTPACGAQTCFLALESEGVYAPIVLSARVIWGKGRCKRIFRKGRTA